MWARRNLHDNGGIGCYSNTMLVDCVASEGNKHCIHVGPGSTVTNCEADRGYFTSDAFMMVYNGQGLWAITCNNKPTGSQVNIRYMTLYDGLDIMDTPSIDHNVDEDLIDIFKGTFPEVGDN
jgi:hypothetical protein